MQGGGMRHPVRTADVWKLLWQAMFAGQGRRLVLGTALAALTVLAGIGLLGLAGWFIAATAIAGLHAASALAFDVFMPSAGIRLLALGRTLSRYGERLVTHDVTLAALVRLRQHLFLGWAARPDANEALLRHPARALFRLTGDLDALESFYLRLWVPACAGLAAVLMGGLALGIMAPWFGLALAVWLIVVGVALTRFLVMRSRRPALRRAHLTERLRAQAIDLVSGQTELLMAGRLAAHCESLRHIDRRLAIEDRRLNRLDVAGGAIQDIAGSVALAMVVLGAAALMQQQLITTPVAVLALLLVLGVMEPFAALRRGALEAGRLWLAARRLAPYCSAGTDDGPGPADSARQGAPLELRGVSACYPGSSVDVLHDVSFRLSAGERVAVIGSSGAGKTTLMALIAGELRAHAGQIRAQPHAWLSQRIDLFQDSVRDNLRLACARATDDVLWQALEQAGLAADIHGLYDGLDTRLGEGGLGLSGGQARRLALARMLLQDRQLWLLDEPTEGLDALTAADVLQRLEASGRQAAWLIATHLRREAALADRLLVLDSGRITAVLHRGSPEFAGMLARLRED